MYILSSVTGFALLVGILRNIYWQWHYRRLRGKGNGGVARLSAMSHVSTIVREKATLPALRGEDHIRHPQFYGNPYAIPTRINTILLLAFTLLISFPAALALKHTMAIYCTPFYTRLISASPDLNTTNSFVTLPTALDPYRLQIRRC
jgi:hypothetical protein